MELLENFDPLLRALWYIALPVSLFFILQTIATFIGLGDSGTDGDTEGGDGGDMPFEVFTLRNLINFLLGFSWTGISFYNIIPNKVILIAVAIGVGILFILLFFWMITQILKLSENNSFKIENTLNKTGEVYINIPKLKSGKGKVQISVNGSYHELDAITTNTQVISSGTLVKVVGLENNILIVERI